MTTDCQCRQRAAEAKREAAEIAAAHERLQPWAFIYMVTPAGGARVPMWLAGRRDAEAFCTDERTKGVGRGGPWMFVFTSASNYLYNPLGYSSIADLSKAAAPDDGRFAALADELGIRLHGRDEFATILDPLVRGEHADTEADDPAEPDLLALLDGGVA